MLFYSLFVLFLSFGISASSWLGFSSSCSLTFGLWDWICSTKNSGLGVYYFYYTLLFGCEDDDDC